MATTDFFVPQASDWAAGAISTLFESDGVLSASIGLYNFIFASIGGVSLLWLLLRVVMETGQHGSIAGKNSEVWFPIRFVVTVGLLAPLPPVGLNSAEYVVIGVARAGSAAASAVWDTAIDVSSKMRPIVVPVPPSVADLAGGLFMIEICQQVQNMSAAATGGTRITPTRRDTSRLLRVSYDGDTAAGGAVGQCGAITFPTVDPSSTDAADAAAQKILNVQYTATLALQAELAAAAAELAPQLLPPFTSGKPRAPSIDITAAMRRYTTTLMAGAGDVIAEENDRLKKYSATATNAGWAKAGAWAMAMAQTNGTLLNAVQDGLPEITEPQYNWWADKIYNAERVAMISAGQWWATAYATRTASTEWDDYNATAATGEAWRLTSVFDVARYKFLYDKILMKEGQNPLSEMVALGHSLLNIFWGTVAAYVGLRVAAMGADAEAGSHILGILANQAFPIKALSAGAVEALQTVAPIFWLIALAFLSAGFALAYVLPLTPALIWLYAVARWLMRVIMTVLGANVWAIAHLELEGEGIGQKAAHGYIFLLDLLIRPMIMTISLIAGFAALMVFGELFSMTYFEAVRNTITGHHAGITGLVAYTIIGAGAMIQLCRIAMSGVDEAADYALGMAAWHLTHRGGSADTDTQQTEHRAASGAHQGQQAMAAGAAGAGIGKGGSGGEKANPGASPGHSMQNSLPGEIGPGEIGRDSKN